MKKSAKLLTIVAISFSCGIGGSIFYNKVEKKESVSQAQITGFNPYYTSFPSLPANIGSDELNTTFISASEKCSPSVVFIKAMQQGVQNNYSSWDMFFNFFGNQGPTTSFGSGVIVSVDGYIVTNNHVVKDADKVEVVVSGVKKNYTATVIGLDASSDLALLKIDAKGLTAIEFDNSDNVKVGEWVLAVGNPFNLNSTVTSGIVSAKGRNINASKDKFSIESFIQTDAAINPGNSGGALVDLNGKLVGINTAILSQTGSYAGYGFAIPSNIVAKVIKDFKDYGIVQRAFIEAEIIDIDEQIAKKLNDENINGVYVNKVSEYGNASKAGLKKEDVIIRMNDVKVKNRAEFDENLAYRRPGDKISLEVIRENKIVKIEILLLNSEGTAEVLKNNLVTSAKLGASFKPLSKVDKESYGIESGVKVVSVKSGMLQDLGIVSGFIILSVNNQKFDTAEELIQVLENFKGWLTVKGISPEGWMVTRSIKIY